MRIPLPHISGSDVAGEVVYAPAARRGPGTRVHAAAGPQLRRVRRLPRLVRDNLCARYDVLGYQEPTAATRSCVAVPVANLVPIPDTLDFVRGRVSR